MFKSSFLTPPASIALFQLLLKRVCRGDRLRVKVAQIRTSGINGYRKLSRKAAFNQTQFLTWTINQLLLRLSNWQNELKRKRVSNYATVGNSILVKNLVML